MQLGHVGVNGVQRGDLVAACKVRETDTNYKPPHNTGMGQCITLIHVARFMFVQSTGDQHPQGQWDPCGIHPGPIAPMLTPEPCCLGVNLS